MADARLRDLERAALTDPLAAARLRAELERLGWCPECRQDHPHPATKRCEAGDHAPGTRCATCWACRNTTWGVMGWLEGDPDEDDGIMAATAVPSGTSTFVDGRGRHHYAKAAARIAVEADPCHVRRAKVLEAARPWPHDFAWGCAVARYGSQADALASYISRVNGLRGLQYSYPGTSNTGSGTILRVDSLHGDPQPPR